MNKRILIAFLILLGGSMAFMSSCDKAIAPIGVVNDSLYFPMMLGKYVTYDVDSVYYYQDNCKKIERSSQVRYSVSDTFRDSKHRLSFLIDVAYRATENDIWKKQSVIYATPAYTVLVIGKDSFYSSLEYVQTNIRVQKLTFPIVEGAKWPGNKLVPVNDTLYSFLDGWAYTYEQYKKPYNNNILYFDNTVTVLANDETVANTLPDSIKFTYRSFYKEVYAYNVGMVYREVKRLSYDPTQFYCIQGYTLIMRAVDHN